MTTFGSTLWPGPIPYHEGLAHLFFGREREVKQMVTTTFGRMGVLSAQSGAGKTSILSAGYIPALRTLRAAGRATPPVLLLREWGGGGHKEPERQLYDLACKEAHAMQSRGAIWQKIAQQSRPKTKLWRKAKAIEKMLGHDSAEFLRRKLELAAEGRSMEPNADSPPPWDVLLEAMGGDLILVLDQVEEFMGSGTLNRNRRQTEKAVAAIGSLYQQQPHITILVALRSEYTRDLQRILNRYVPDLNRRVIDLEHLPRKSIADVLIGAATRASHKTDTPEAQRFIQFVSSTRDSTNVEDSEGSDTGQEPFGLSDRDEVLGIQALLLGYETWCRADNPDNQLVLSKDNLDRYIEYLVKSKTPTNCEEEDISRAVSDIAHAGKFALEAWVRAQLDDVADADHKEGEPIFDESPQRSEARRRLSRWLLHTILPELATIRQGFKQHPSLLGLYQIIAGKLSPEMHILSRDLEDRLKTWLSSDFGEVELELPDELPTLRLSTFGDDLVRYSKAPAQQRGEKTASYVLVWECLLTLRAIFGRLRRKHILKFTGQGSERSCELVHDLLNEHVGEWYRTEAATPKAILGSPVPIHGDLFSWRTLEDDVHGAHWIGTTLNEAIIRNVKFVGCDLKGMFFHRCTFENVVFENCILDAAVFRCDDTEFPDEMNMNEVTFNRCSARSTAFMNCSFGENIKFTGSLLAHNQAASGIEALTKAKKLSDLTSASFTGCTVRPGQPVEFESCIIRFALVNRFHTVRGSDKVTPELHFTKCDLMNAWIWDAGFDTVEIDESCRTIGMLSFDLPDPAYLDRRETNTGRPENDR